MKLLNSVCTNLVFPNSRKDVAEFRRMAEFLSESGTYGIEFYHDGPERGKIGTILSDTGLNGIYIGVIPSKEQKRYLCDEDEDARKSAVALYQECMEEAQSWGLTQVMLNSGGITRNIDKGLEQLGRSIEELFGYAARKHYRMDLFMEPCDSHMDARHLVGPWRRTLAFTEKLNAAGLPLKLTMDSAHTAEEGEDFLEAVTAVRAHCNHVHFANCRISNPEDPLYGDRHIGFEYEDSVWTPETLAELFRGLEALYPGEEPLRVGIEVLCRTEDPYAYWRQMWNSLPFLHRKQEGCKQ